MRIQGYVDEGIAAYIAPVSRNGPVPLTRYLNVDKGSHFYNAGPSRAMVGRWKTASTRKRERSGTFWEHAVSLPSLTSTTVFTSAANRK